MSADIVIKCESIKDMLESGMTEEQIKEILVNMMYVYVGRIVKGIQDEKAA